MSAESRQRSVNTKTRIPRVHSRVAQRDEASEESLAEDLPQSRAKRLNIVALKRSERPQDQPLLDRGHNGFDQRSASTLTTTAGRFFEAV